jgi:hypothetical protein
LIGRMMETLVWLFVGKPAHILVGAAFFLAGYIVRRRLRRGAARQSRPLLIASATWGLYAAWEWLVQTKTPEANIRVDLMVIWPMVGLLSLWALWRACR